MITKRLVPRRLVQRRLREGMKLVIRYIDKSFKSRGVSGRTRVYIVQSDSRKQ